jgi:hypothetical protein
MKRLLTSRAATAAISAVLTLVVAGGGYAIASGGGTITVCVSHTTGALYRAGGCRKRDRKLSWNQTGPQGVQGNAGAQGAQGIQGIQGIQGVTGPSNGYSAEAVGGNGLSGFSIGDTPTTVSSLSLPAGSYMISGEATIYDTNATENDQCYLQSPSDTKIAVSYGSTTSTTPNGVLTEFAPLTTSGGTVTMVCYGTDSATDAVNAEGVHLTAIQLATVTGS